MRWSKKEIDILKDEYSLKTNKELAQRLNRTKDSIAEKTRTLGLKKLKKWSSKDIKTIKKSYFSSSNKDLSKDLNRSISAIKSKAILLNLKKDNLPIKWTKEEIEFLKKEYNSSWNKELSNQLNKTIGSIATKANKLGLRKDNLPIKWTKEEINTLKKKYPFTSNDKLSLLFNKNKNSITHVAYRLNLKKDSSWYKSWNKNRLKEFNKRIHSGRISHRKGLTIEQEYGIEKAKLLREKYNKVQIGHKAWNEGLTKKNNESLRKLSEKFKGREFSENTKNKMSKKRKEMYKEGKLPEFIGGEGNKNLAWQGGISFEPYDKTFNNRFKRAIRKRDNQVCMLCGIHREKYWKAFDVHHINYDKLLSIPQNCVSLCHHCHMKTNHNRKHWIEFFQNLLAERYGYKYENQEIKITV